MKYHCDSCNKKNYTEWVWAQAAAKIYGELYDVKRTRPYKCPIDSRYWHTSSNRYNGSKHRKRLRRQYYNRLSALLRGLYAHRATADDEGYNLDVCDSTQPSEG